MAQLSGLQTLRLQRGLERSAAAEAAGEPLPQSTYQFRNADGTLGKEVALADLYAASQGGLGNARLVPGNLADAVSRETDREARRPNPKKNTTIIAVVAVVVVIVALVIFIRK